MAGLTYPRLCVLWIVRGEHDLGRKPNWRDIAVPLAQLVDRDQVTKQYVSKLVKWLAENRFLEHVRYGKADYAVAPKGMAALICYREKLPEEILQCQL